MYRTIVTRYIHNPDSNLSYEVVYNKLRKTRQKAYEDFKAQSEFHVKNKDEYVYYIRTYETPHEKLDSNIYFKMIGRAIPTTPLPHK